MSHYYFAILYAIRQQIFMVASGQILKNNLPSRLVTLEHDQVLFT